MPPSLGRVLFFRLQHPVNKHLTYIIDKILSKIFMSLGLLLNPLKNIDNFLKEIKIVKKHLKMRNVAVNI
jgi:hypothetical protein